MKIGLYFGSFNPVHIGHLIIAQYFVEYSDYEEVWFVVSPQNPFKKKSTLAPEYDRLHLIQLAIENYQKLRASNIEFSLPKPSYTIDTLTALTEKYPQHKFGVLMGSDNLKNFHKWKNHEQIVNKFTIKVYPRPGFDFQALVKKYNAEIVNAPLMEISSTFIRHALRDGKNVSTMLSPKVWDYLEGSSIYSD